MLDYVRDILRYSRNHTYYSVIEKSYLGIFMGKNLKGIAEDEIFFLKNNMNMLYLEREILCFRHKPILPVSKIRIVCSRYHEALHHPNAISLFEIISREFVVFPQSTLQCIEAICNECNICLSTPEGLLKVSPLHHHNHHHYYYYY